MDGMMEEVDEILVEAEKIDRETDGKPSLYGYPIREPDNRRVEKRKFDIKQLWDRHKEILQLTRLGYKGVEIARMLNIDPQTVSNTLNSTLGKDAREVIRQMRDEEYDALYDDVLELTRKSLEKYEEILDNESASLSLQKETADTIVLEVAGMRAPTKIQSASVHAVLGPEELEDFKNRGMEAARAAGKLIEVGSESFTSKDKEVAK